MKESYLAAKFTEIETEVAVAVTIANFIGINQGKCTDGVIEARDIATARILRAVRQLLKRAENEDKNQSEALEADKGSRPAVLAACPAEVG